MIVTNGQTGLEILDDSVGKAHSLEKTAVEQIYLPGSACLDGGLSIRQALEFRVSLPQFNGETAGRHGFARLRSRSTAGGAGAVICLRGGGANNTCCNAGISEYQYRFEPAHSQ